MKYNKGFSLMIIIAVVAGLLAMVGTSYWMGRNSNKVDQEVKTEENQNESSLSKNQILGLREYVNNEAGFSFKYQDIYGDIKIKKSLGPNGEGYGYHYRGLAGEYPHPFYFYYQTKDYNGSTGDGGETGYENKIVDDCIQKNVSCEIIKSKDGLDLKLAKNLTVGTVDPYSFRVSLPNNIAYKDLVFVSSDRSLLISIASEFKLIKPEVDNCSTWLTYNGIYTVKYPNCWTVESIKGGSIGSTGYETGILLKPLKALSENDSIFIAGWQNTCSNVSFSNNKDSMTKAYCLKSENGEKWVGEYVTPSNPVNPKNLYYVPVTTRSNNPDVLKMFDLIVSENNK